MFSRLKAKIKDIPLVSGYLHDSIFTPSDYQFKPESNQFELNIYRIAYEKAKKGKLLFFFHCIRYPGIKSKLILTGVKKMEIEWLNDAFDGPKSRHTLLAIDPKDDNTTEIYSEWLKIILYHSDQVELILEDIAEPTKRGGAIDFSESVFQCMEEIEKLKY